MGPWDGGPVAPPRHVRHYVRMPAVEMSRAKVVARLERDGWENVGGKCHDKFRHPHRPTPIIVPRHRSLSPGVARSIAAAAGWLGSMSVE